MKTYLIFKNENGQEVDSTISHYKTLAGLKRYGQPWLRVKNAMLVEVYSFSDSSQLYSNNMQLLGTISLQPLKGAV